MLRKSQSFKLITSLPKWIFSKESRINAHLFNFHFFPSIACIENQKWIRFSMIAIIPVKYTNKHIL